ncbi:hypothetical protein BG004_005342 [Podila humilis]|nr:hypothetical protein BG004_005342 [Podila humilis]
MDHDDDDETAQEWQNTHEQAAASSNNVPMSDSDDYWFIPTYTSIDMLEKQLESISNDSGTHLLYDRNKNRIEMWGPYPSIQKAKEILDHFSKHYLQAEEKRIRANRAKGWARPDRELTAAEKRKAERKERVQKEQERYSGVPKDVLPYQHCFICPESVPIFRLLGGNLQLLDPLRAEFKSYIWIEKSNKLDKPVESVYHILEKPSKTANIHIVKDAPAPFIRPSRWKHEGGPIMFMKAVLLDGYETLAAFDDSLAQSITGLSVSSNDPNSNSTSSSHGSNAANVQNNVKTIKYFESMHTFNKERIRKHLLTSLHQLQLMDYEMKMRIHIGQVGLKDYPKNDIWAIDDLDTRIIPDKRLASDFHPYIVRSANELKNFMDALTPNFERLEGEHTRWSLGILKRNDSPGDALYGELDVTFRDDGKLGLWNALVERSKPLEIKVICSQRKYSWAWDITTARRLPLDKFSPEGVFAHNLSLEKRAGFENRMVFSNTPDIQLRRIRREKRTVYAKDNWKIEVVEESFWILEKAFKPSQAVTLLDEPTDVMCSISMFRESWANRFAENPFLGIGQVPYWSPEDFISEQESLESTLEFVSTIQDLLERTRP